MRTPSPLERRLGHTFGEPDLLERALTHRSVSRNASNERLEFLGDAYLGQTVAHALFEACADASEAQMTRMRSQLVRNETLAEVAAELGIPHELRLGASAASGGGQQRPSILAGALEAVIGALVLDAGEARAREIVLAILRNRFEAVVRGGVQKDAKTRLQEWLQGRGETLPEYEVEGIEGQSPDEVFTVVCRVTALAQQSRARAGSRKEAERRAAEAMLVELGVDAS